MNPSDLLPSLPDEARLWIHAADWPLAEDEQRALRRALDAFVQTWTSHGRDVQGEYELLEGRFLLVGARVPAHDVSGCGIDKLVHLIEETAGELGFAWLSPLHVFYRAADGTPQHASRAAFRRLAGEGAVTAETPVFDLNLASVGDLRAGRFEQPAGASWHARAFSLAQPAA